MDGRQRRSTVPTCEATRQSTGPRSSTTQCRMPASCKYGADAEGGGPRRWNVPTRQSVPAHLHFSIRVRVQLEDAIDRNSVPVAPGAVLSWSIELSVVLEDPPCRPGRANIALYGVGTMRSPGPQR